jgi:hypothetical protein
VYARDNPDSDSARALSDTLIALYQFLATPDYLKLSDSKRTMIYANVVCRWLHRSPLPYTYVETKWSRILFLPMVFFVGAAIVQLLMCLHVHDTMYYKVFLNRMFIGFPYGFTHTISVAFTAIFL